ncbi:hypothetical protein HanXRQr2_Chr16g0734461 [Helianthus annuus]|uniref:Uncharacterized protein n=1 Tax=Helianthus annuus TaxID=4232 RepID=A0A251RXW9_HELAN|nr:hypothetical protein HanXRQr2_Chr16g0734461 [Helianthus annuus]
MFETEKLQVIDLQFKHYWLIRIREPVFKTCLIYVEQGACLQNVLDSTIQALLADKNQVFLLIKKTNGPVCANKKRKALCNSVDELKRARARIRA